MDMSSIKWTQQTGFHNVYILPDCGTSARSKRSLLLTQTMLNVKHVASKEMHGLCKV